jgi:transposase-like protein
MDLGPGRRRRRMHSAEFKAEAVAACRKPDASIAACAMERSVNANLLRRWVIEAERGEPKAIVSAPPAPSARPQSFLSVTLPNAPSDDTPIRIEVRRGALTVSVQWPSTATHACALWLRELIK